MTIETYPVLFLDDVVILPGMALPIELTAQAQATLDAARAAHDGSPDPLRLLFVPRLDGHYGVIGSTVEVIQLGRLPSGEPAAVLRATGRAKIGQGVTGPGAALWVEAERIDTPTPSPATRE